MIGYRALGRLAVAVLGMLVTALAWAQGESTVTEADRARAALAILLFVVLGVALIYGLLWWLRARGILPEEKPLPRPRWVHPEDDGDDAG